MTKDYWLIVREQPEIPMLVWFEYYKEKGGYVGNLKEFESIFVQILRNEPVIPTRTGPVKITFGTSLHRLFLHYNKLFNV